ncbi:hypothetical protein ACN20G_31720 (plasmid) [Streptomyces sp. BI20]|uniref:hypothetical protein n=1 Tax=Streptomyces sp. BI20 TaxID=3403460 RepID=UPI003C731FB7
MAHRPTWLVVDTQPVTFGMRVVARLLDPEGTGAVIHSAQHPDLRVDPAVPRLLLADTTLYGIASVEHALRAKPAQLPPPWLLLVSDAPTRPVRAARYRLRALAGRVAGTVTVPYLGALRAAGDEDEALADPEVRAAGTRLRRRLTSATPTPDRTPTEKRNTP